MPNKVVMGKRTYWRASRKGFGKNPTQESLKEAV